MILRLFSSNQPLLLVVSPIIASSVLFPAASFLSPVNLDFPVDCMLEQGYSIPYFVSGAAVLLITLGALLINHIFNRHEFFLSPSYLPSLIYTLLATGMCLIDTVLPVLLANIFLLIGINRILDVHRQSRVLSEYFITGFFFGMASLTFPPFLLLAAGMWLCIVYTRTFNFRENFIPLLAFGIPFLYWVVWKFWWRMTDDLVLFHRVFSFDQVGPLKMLSYQEQVFLIAIAGTFLLALPQFVLKNSVASTRARSIKMVFIILTIAIVASFFFSYLSLGHWVLLTAVVPIALVLGFWFTNYRVSLIAPFVFYGLVATFLLSVLSTFGIVVF